jgi:hypothetical protein
MIDQYSKYKDNKEVKIITCSFYGDNRGYSYLCDFYVNVGDTVVARMKDGEMKCLTVQAVKDSSCIMPNPPFKKYAWVCGIVGYGMPEFYMKKDDDIGMKSNASDLGAVEVPKPAPPKDDLDERMKSIFG